MKYLCLIAFIPLLLTACGEGQPKQAMPLPTACELLTLKQLKEIMREPVEQPVPTAANVGEHSACTYNMPGRGRNDNLVIYVLKNTSGKDAAQFDALVAEWQGRNGGAGFTRETASGYPMAFFPGEPRVYPPTFLIAFEQVALAIQGAAKDDAKSIAFRAMVQYQWK